MICHWSSLAWPRSTLALCLLLLLHLTANWFLSRYGTSIDVVWRHSWTATTHIKPPCCLPTAGKPTQAPRISSGPAFALRTESTCCRSAYFLTNFDVPRNYKWRLWTIATPLCMKVSSWREGCLALRKYFTQYLYWQAIAQNVKEYECLYMQLLCIAAIFHVYE